MKILDLGYPNYCGVKSPILKHMLAQEKTPSGFGFGKVWGDIHVYKKYITTHLYDFVMTGWNGGPNRATMLDELANGYGRFVRSMLHPTIPVLSHNDAMWSSLMYPRLLRMLWKNFQSTDPHGGKVISHIFYEELVKMDDVSLIRQYMYLSCMCGTGMHCHYDIVLAVMGPAVYRVIKPQIMADDYFGHEVGINDINTLVINNRCDAFPDVFAKIVKKQPLDPLTLNDLLARAARASNIVAIRCILNSGLASAIPVYAGPWELFRVYNVHTLEIGKMFVARGHDLQIDEELVRTMVRHSDDVALIAWMVDLAAKNGTCVSLGAIALTAIACDRKSIWKWLVAQGLVYTTSHANMAAMHGRMSLLEEMHKAGIDCQRSIVNEMHPVFPRALETWILRYGV